MELVNEIIKTCDSLKETINNYIVTFNDNTFAISEFNRFLEMIQTIKVNVNEENKDIMRNALLDLQTRIDEMYIKVSSMNKQR